MELLTRESIDRDRDDHWLAQTLRAGYSSFDAEGTVLLLAGSEKGGLALAPARTEQRFCWPAPGRMD
jgi:hypothetical protein